MLEAMLGWRLWTSGTSGGDGRQGRLEAVLEAMLEAGLEAVGRPRGGVIQGDGIIKKIESGEAKKGTASCRHHAVIVCCASQWRPLRLLRLLP